MNSLGYSLQPKSHQFVHMTLSIGVKGNPRFYNTFHDESLNLILAGIASVSHRATWERTIFQRVQLLPIVQISLPLLLRQAPFCEAVADAVTFSAQAGALCALMCGPCSGPPDHRMPSFQCRGLSIDSIPSQSKARALEHYS
eukprot:9031259-Pyramimonas_sp.AAC.1